MTEKESSDALDIIRGFPQWMENPSHLKSVWTFLKKAGNWAIRNWDTLLTIGGAVLSLV
jgi:hypothetical protein